MRSLIFGVRLAGLADARQIALHVGHEDRHADRAEALGHALQRHRLAGAGRARRSVRGGWPARAAGRARCFDLAISSGSGMTPSAC